MAASRVGRGLLLLHVLALAGPAEGVVDESGRYRQGGDLSHLAPPEPTEEDRSAAVDLSAQPPEKLFRLLAYELAREEKRPGERRLGIREFQLLTERSCPERLLSLASIASEVSEEVRVYHLNITGTAGLYWLLHKYPEEHSWVWVISASHERVLRKVGQLFSRMAVFALDDTEGCLSPSFRSVLMNSAMTWRKLYGDETALLWNGIAFGLLGDVTSWREVDEDGQAANEPGGPPPNVSWSENLIFGNMWVSSVQKWLEYQSTEISRAAYMDIARAQAGVAPESHGQRWHQSESGALSSFEFLRRQLFGGWPLDKGLLRAFLRHCLKPGFGAAGRRPTVGDFGAGGGRYSEWLNDTGLVEAFAYDGTFAAGDITGGAVQEADLGAELQLPRTFDWVLCLEVVPHLSAAQLGALLDNVRKHADKGFVLSWSASPAEGQTPPPPDDELLSLVRERTGFALDRAATDALRRGCELEQLARTVTAFGRAAY